MVESIKRVSLVFLPIIQPLLFLKKKAAPKLSGAAFLYYTTKYYSAAFSSRGGRGINALRDNLNLPVLASTSNNFTSSISPSLMPA